MIALIDNYDSFVHNLARHLRLLGQETVVVRNDAATITEIQALEPQAIVISPGPGRPSEAGISLAAVKHFHGKLPLLGVCLGHQAIGEAFGATVLEAAEIMHGRTSVVRHEGQGLFSGLPIELTVCRYHSLVIEPASLSETGLVATAWADDGTIMAVRHETEPTFGIQFHPEAILTDAGPALLRNFLQLL